MRCLTDDDIRRIVTPARARSWMREALLAANRGELVSPARVSASLPSGRLTFTCGELRDAWFGYRSYLAPGAVGDQQMVVLHRSDGQVAALAVGVELGPRRVGAIGGVAAEELAPGRVDKIAVVGSGTQAWYQLWALPDRLRSAHVAVYSPDAHHRDDFAARVRDRLGLSATASRSCEEAIFDASMIIVATASRHPVLDPRKLAAEAYVTTVGPKQVGRAEFGPELAERADVLVTDSIAQVRKYDPPHILVGSPHFDRLVELGDILACHDRVSSGVRVFLSSGLAGTEVYLLSRALESQVDDGKGENCDR